MNWVDLGSLESIPRLGARVVAGPDGNVAVFRTANDAVFALADRCPHRGGPLSQGIVHGERVTCPLHNWVIDLNTGAATGPDTGCADAYRVRLEQGHVWLDLDTLPRATGQEIGDHSLGPSASLATGHEAP